MPVTLPVVTVESPRPATAVTPLPPDTIDEVLLPFTVAAPPPSAWTPVAVAVIVTPPATLTVASPSRATELAPMAGGSMLPFTVTVELPSRAVDSMP